MLAEKYYLHFAAAFVRGKRIQGEKIPLPEELLQTPLDDLTLDQCHHIFAIGQDAGLKLHKFKRTMGLRRVRLVLGTLQSLSPGNLLDIGSGRGVFLWPLLDQFPGLPVMSIDRLARRVDDLKAVAVGGVSQLSAMEMDAVDLGFEDDEFDVVVMLEVLEHIGPAQLALNEAVRAARRFVVMSVPSKEDDNPEHIHLFDARALSDMLGQAGAANVRFEHVPGHLLAVARTYQ